MSCPLTAQSDPYPRLWNWELTPLFGYRTDMSFTTEPGIEGVPANVLLKASPAFGMGFGVRYHDEDAVELRYSRQDTHFHINGPIVAPSSQHVTLDQFHLDCTHEYVVDEWPPWVRPYIMGSFGVTHVSSTESIAGFTRFSFGLGTGVKVFPSRHVGFKMQAEWLPILVNARSKSICNGGCVIHVNGTLASQGEFIAGPVFRF